MRGPEVRLSPRMALALSMALQELDDQCGEIWRPVECHGDGGHRLGCRRRHSPRMRFFCDGRRRGGPAVQAPTRRGFGSRLIERSLARELNGDGHIEFQPSGVVCTLEAPLA